MRSKQIPSPNCLVVKLGGRSAETTTQLSALGNLEPLPGSDRMVLEVQGAAVNAKDLWRRVLDAVERVAWAAPVVMDETGAPHYPTGEISIRFRRALTAQELETFTNAHGIRIRSRNEFVPQQVTVEPIEERERYLPEVVEQISAEESGLAAWADTLSEFRR